VSASESNGLSRAQRRERLLADYARELPRAGRRGEIGFLGLLGVCLLLALVLGATLRSVPLPPQLRAAAAIAPARFQVVPAVHLPRKAEPEPVAAPRPRPVTPPVLTPRTQLAEPAPTPAPTPTAPPRRVYGVRKIYGRALGDETGGDVLVGKAGNSAEGPSDSLQARPEDLVPGAVSLSSVERAPVPVHVERPAYTQAMIDARASGVVNARLLVNAAGEVEQVDVLDDFGFDSARLAAEACRHFRFEPALQGGRPVAVWILYKIRFEFAG